MKKYYVETRKKDSSYIQYNEGKLNALVTPCAGTAFQTTLLKDRWKDTRKYKMGKKTQAATG